MPHDSSLHVHAWEVQLVSTQFPDILGAVVQELINANPGRKLNEVLMSLIKTTFLKAKFILTVQADFLQAFFSQLLKLRSTCEDLSSI